MLEQRQTPASDLIHETWQSWAGMPRRAQVWLVRSAAVIGATLLVGFVAAFARLRRA